MVSPKLRRSFISLKSGHPEIKGATNVKYWPLVAAHSLPRYAVATCNFGDVALLHFAIHRYNTCSSAKTVYMKIARYYKIPKC